MLGSRSAYNPPNLTSNLRVQAALCRCTTGKEESIDVWYAPTAVENDGSNERPSNDVGICQIINNWLQCPSVQAYNAEIGSSRAA
jgi:hypothetical protein